MPYLYRFAVLLALATPVGHAAAHALVIESDPAAGATVPAAPARAALRFNSRIDQERSRLTLIGADGVGQSLAVAATATPTALEAPLPASLAPGAWRLRWQVLAADGHITRGDIAFTVVGPR